MNVEEWTLARKNGPSVRKNGPLREGMDLERRRMGLGAKEWTLSEEEWTLARKNGP
ncbi:hypothetical protein QTL97_05450 [Sporosarcina thermotolerans]|uniref:Uncharacterized protein n=1 Tax=Sporosarcina thermotolerans TaxID=633404 RepID=A0AAW9A7Q6_9BACL|nr:hypothetical protein [Sporosarcina thermotolerans]MDW0116370.1 hypothetical protein [Sporosarcina thermotolerans]WHT48331.1 hypothetical protein QNH10_00165 [Sporosarcina thermotolerans]